MDRAARAAAGKGRKKTIQEETENTVSSADLTQEKTENIMPSADLTEKEKAQAQTGEGAPAAPENGKKKGVFRIGDEMPIYYY